MADVARSVETASYLYSVERDEALGAIVFKWHEFVSGERFREGANALLRRVQSTDASKLIVDVRPMTAHDRADQEWLQQEWMPRMVEAGIESVAVVRADTPFAEAEMRRLMRRLETRDITSTLAVDMTEARRWVAEQ